MSDIASQADRDAIARAVAERALLRHGARIIAQGWSCPEGSIDFIAEKDGELVLADARMAESTAREDMERPVPGETPPRSAPTAPTCPATIFAPANSQRPSERK